MNTVIVCGGGAAGLGVAAELGRRGVDVEVLERTDGVGASWRARYEDLRLNTSGWMSSMPGYRARSRRYGEFPTRDAWVRYLEDYTEHHGISTRFGTAICSIDRDQEGWAVDTTRGTRHAHAVVVALGMEHDPFVPDWEGQSDYPGELLHASEFHNATPYRGRDVLVVGPNVTGSEIASLLVEGGASRVRVACRTSPNLTRRKLLGLNVNIPGIVLNRAPSRVGDEVGWLVQRLMFGRLDQFGLPRSPQGVATTIRERRQAPAYADGLVRHLKAGRLEVVPAVVGFDGPRVVLADGTELEPDVVIAATGYRPGLEPLVGHLGVLDVDGHPLVSGGEQHPQAPGLFFNGYRSDLTGHLRVMRLGAKAIARTIAKL